MLSLDVHIFGCTCACLSLSHLADCVENVRDVQGWSPVLVEDVRADLPRVCLDVGVVDPSHELDLIRQRHTAPREFSRGREGKRGG